MRTIGHTPGHDDLVATATVADCESVLSDWFEAPVILTSSGRAAMRLYFFTKGLSRYRHRVALPRLISGCVMDVVIRHAFPVDPAAANAADCDAAIVYHQYGLPQLSRPAGPARLICEDICHAFFASAATGARTWRGEVAVFSLPKAFRTSAMCGGLVVPDRELAARLRDLRDASPRPRDTDRRREGEDFRRAVRQGGPDLEMIYLQRLLNPHILDSELGGVPNSLEDIRTIGRRRRRTLQRLVARLPKSLWPEGWSDWLVDAMPFACPVFGPPEALAADDAALRGIGVKAGLYQIDIARNADAPVYRPSLLIPCHHDIPDDLTDEIGDILSRTLAARSGA